VGGGKHARARWKQAVLGRGGCTGEEFRVGIRDLEILNCGAMGPGFSGLWAGILSRKYLQPMGLGGAPARAGEAQDGK
jgi:hypothetical protein